MRNVDLTPVSRPDKLSSYFRKEWKQLAVVALAGIVFNLGQGFVLVRQGRLIDMVVAREPLEAVTRSALLFLLLIFVLQLARYLKRFGVRRFSNRTIARMRQQVYGNILSRSLVELEDEQTGDLMTKAVGDVDITVEGMRKVTTEIFDTGFLMAGYVATLFLSSPKITLYSIWCVPLSMTLASLLKNLVGKASRAAREAQSSTADLTYNMASKIALERTDSMEEAVLDKYDQSLETLRRKAAFAAILESSLQPLYKAVAGLGIFSVLFFGGKEVLAGNWTVGSYSSYLLIYTALIVKASKASKLFNAFTKARVSYQRVKPYLHPFPSAEQATGVPSATGLQVSHLSFTYPRGKQEILRNVSFEAQTGQIVGITGPVASGKTTLGIALEGLYPYEGSIKLGGREIRDMSEGERSALISWQSHHSELLSASIKENVTLGLEGDIGQVLKDVQFQKDLEEMPEGEETVVGSSGVRLSGGQAQRVSLARALWRHSPLIILDDPFASVDLRTERLIIEALKARYRNSLILLFSHRLSIFPETDQVWYLDGKGNLKTGTHRSQLDDNPDYRAMWELQEAGRA